jgi:hypothetical protein
MLVYNFSFTSTTVPAAGTFITSLYTQTTSGVGTGRSVMILEVDIEGGNNTSMYSEIGFFRVASAAGTIASGFSGGVTAPPVDLSAPTAACLWSIGPYASGSTGPTGLTPTLATIPVHRIGINGNGQRYFWRANPNLNNAIVVPGTGVVSTTVFGGGLILASITAGTTNPISGRIQFAEL